MKTGIVIISMILLLNSFISKALAQEDSIINFDDFSCSFIRTSVEKNLNDDKMIYTSFTEDIMDLKSLILMKNDSIVIKSRLDSSYKLKMNQLIEINRIKGNRIVPGIILGTIIGGLSGYVIGASSPYVQPGTPALLGACAGALIGYIIGSLALDYETLNFLKIPTKEKKAELIKFIRQK